MEAGLETINILINPHFWSLLSVLSDIHTLVSQLINIPTHFKSFSRVYYLYKPNQGVLVHRNGDNEKLSFFKGIKSARLLCFFSFQMIGITLPSHSACLLLDGGHKMLEKMMIPEG